MIKINIGGNEPQQKRQPETVGEFIIKILVNAVAVIITSYLLRGVHIDNILTAILVAATLSLLNTFLKPALILLTIPATIFTFGFFLLAINAFIILLASNIVEGFHVDGFWWAVLFSIVLSMINSILNVNRQRRIPPAQQNQNPGTEDVDFIEVDEKDS